MTSTAGLDGYKLYDAARFSGRTVEVTAATALEKVIGVSGIFLSFLVALPFGIKIFGDNAGVIAAVTVPGVARRLEGAAPNEHFIMQPVLTAFGIVIPSVRVVGVPCLPREEDSL